MIKPGIKSTEFWVALTVALMGVLAAAFSEETWARIVGIIAAALTSVGYSVSRAVVKRSNGTAPDGTDIR